MIVKNVDGKKIQSSLKTAAFIWYSFTKAIFCLRDEVHSKNVENMKFEIKHYTGIMCPVNHGPNWTVLELTPLRGKRMEQMPII